MAFRGGGNSVSIHGYKGPTSSLNGAPPPQHTFGASMAGYAAAQNINSGRPELLEALNVLGFTQPSKIQEFALPLLIMEPPTNIIAQSQSGTGKTATFVLTMLSRVNASVKHPQCLCLAPTYELAIQIGEHYHLMLVDYLTKYHCLDPSHISCLVLDEADVMINQAGYTEQSTQIYKTIETHSPGVQTMLFSATYGEDVVKFAMQLIKNAVTVT
ncbi:DEAD/DEAH box helicase [Teladorsagia circumcincta]|uniref:DEAD/DEAH box helicase n=1 Tax=Teladorsagia circumcincta TaxID=45464 RepID=A0A2G9V5S9_TELCI|nr:DEAD/DEAH box helicase [Teladorsagia circumcincta]